MYKHILLLRLTYFQAFLLYLQGYIDIQTNELSRVRTLQKTHMNAFVMKILYTFKIKEKKSEG